MTRHVCGLALLVCCLAPLLAGPPAGPVDELRSLVMRTTGSQPVACGRQLLVERNGGYMPAPVSDLQRSVACGVKAASSGCGLWAFKQNPGIDSWSRQLSF